MSALEQLDAGDHPGLLAHIGFAVLEPFVVHGSKRMSYLDRQEQLAQYRARLMSLDPACAPLDAQTA